MSINLRTGQPGHGKSYSSVVEIYEALAAGKWVATNVPLVEGWEYVFARQNPLRRLSKEWTEKRAAEYRERLYHVDDLTELRRLRIPPCGKCPGCKAGTGCRKEGRGKAVLDEAHKWLNSRTWDTDETGKATTKAEAMKRRLAIVWFFSTHRHRGWDIELLTQDEANLDRQVRSLFETHTHMKNLKRFKLWGFIPVVPCTVFIAVTYWHDSDNTKLGVRMFTLNKKLAKAYDTFGARGDDYDPDAILLGGPEAHPRLLEPAGAAQPAAGSSPEDDPRSPRQDVDGIAPSPWPELPAPGRGFSAPIPGALDELLDSPESLRSSELSEPTDNIAQMPLNEDTPGVGSSEGASNLRDVTAPDAAPTE